VRTSSRPRYRRAFPNSRAGLGDLIDASPDDWDRYESLHWLAAEKWLSEHADDPDAENIRVLNERFRDRSMRWQRELLGWAIIVGRKR
jgi:hypothetical protein